MNCQHCNGLIPDDKFVGRQRRKVLYCSRRCGINYWNKYHRKERLHRPVKKCLHCGKKTNKIKDYCGMQCYHQYQRRMDNGMISTTDYELLNRSFVGVDDVCVVL